MFRNFKKNFLAKAASIATKSSSVLQDADPVKWKEHLFGLSSERWKRLSDMSFWVTGAGTGYGRAISCALAASGAQVFLSGRRPDKLAESIKEAASLFGVSTDRCHPVAFDLLSDDEIYKACDTVKSLSDSALGGLVNNAAVPNRSGSKYPLSENPVTYWDEMIATNVRAPWLLSREIMPFMLSGGAVRVLFTTSEAGWADTPGFGAYNISKASLNSLGFSFASEVAEQNPDADIQINIVSPSEARTEMNRGSSVSPYSIVSITLKLLSLPEGGPNGKFFHRDGRHLDFCYSEPYAGSIS